MHVSILRIYNKTVYSNAAAKVCRMNLAAENRRYYMPYIAIKSYPKDEEAKKRMADKINQLFMEEWNLPPQAISISMESVEPENWHLVKENEIYANPGKMMIVEGEKKY